MIYVEVLPPGALQVERLNDGRRKLLRELVVRVSDLGVVTVPADAETDFSSIPRAVSWLTRWSTVDVAGTVHDWLYQTATTGPAGRQVTRAEADAAWRIIAQHGAGGASWLAAWIGWAGLRLGGWIVWNRYRRA